MLGYVSANLDEQRSRHFLWFPVLLGAGAGTYFALDKEPSLPIAYSLTIIASIAFGIGFLKYPMARTIVRCVCVLATGLVLASWRAHSVAAPVLSEPFIGAVEGRVIKIDRSQSNRLRITVDNLTLYGLEPDQTPARVRITLPSKHAQAKIGSAVLIFAKLEGPGAPVEPGGFDFRRWAWFKRLGGVGYALGPTMKSSRNIDQSFLTVLTAVRHDLADYIRQQIPGKSGAFAAAILTGDRSAIDPGQLDDLRASNLAHLLAISGLHMGLLTGFVFGLVRYGIALFPRLAMKLNGKKIGAATAIPVGAAYLVLSGASIATQRAFIMALVVLLAVILDRPAFTLRAVALAAAIVLLISPESIVSVGFQLSFAATIGLVVGFDLLRRSDQWRQPRKGFQKFLKGAFSVAFSSAVAGFATAPLAAFHFNQFPQYGLIANLLAVPIMGFIVMPCSIVALILAIAGLGQPFFWIAGVGITAILSIANFVAGFDGAVVRVPSPNWLVLPLLAGGFLILVLWVGRMKSIGAVLVAVSIFMWVGTKRPDLLVDRSGDLVGLMTSDGRVLNKGRGQGFVAKAWLEHDGDIADQKTAANRDWSTSKVSYAGRKPVDIEAECRSHAVVVATEIDLAPRTDCLVIDKSLLETVGAVAVYFDRQGDVRWTGSATKERVWTSTQ